MDLLTISLIITILAAGLLILNMTMNIIAKAKRIDYLVSKLEGAIKLYTSETEKVRKSVVFHNEI